MTSMCPPKIANWRFYGRVFDTACKKQARETASTPLPQAASAFHSDASSLAGVATASNYDLGFLQMKTD